MIEDYNITENIIIYPSELKRVDEFMNEKCRSKIGVCTKEYGYILDVVGEQNINYNKISRITGNIIYNITYTIQCIKPVVGSEYSGCISIIFKEGIFAQIDYIQVLIPASNIPNWTDMGSTFRHNETGKVISVGDWIKTKIINVRYNNHQYQCIGGLIEDI